MSAQLTPLDTSFLAVESKTAHMHVGWVTEFSPPERGPTPGFAELRDHIGARLGRAPRYRQRLKQMPFGVGSPSWVDDDDFDLDRHVVRAADGDLMAAASEAMSEPLDHGRPLWEMRIVEGLEGGGVGVIGKAHHCMVDGIAAVELASLLLDPEADPPDPPEDGWTPDRAPAGAELFGRGIAGALAGGARSLAGTPLRLLRDPSLLREVPAAVEAVGRAAVDTVRPAEEIRVLERPLSPARHLGATRRSLEELKDIKRRFGVTVNDVLLAAVAGALREYLISRGEDPCPLKTMVPVDVRTAGENAAAGNRISFMFVDLPCDEPEQIRRLRRVAAETGERKDQGLPGAGEAILDGIGQIPNAVRGAFSRLFSDPRVFNLTVSNIPGPPEPMYMCGCRLDAAYPVVPIPERHALSIGMTSICGEACFGIYADRLAIPDVDEVAAAVDREIDELLAIAPAGAEQVPGAA